MRSLVTILGLLLVAFSVFAGAAANTDQQNIGQRIRGLREDLENILKEDSLKLSTFTDEELAWRKSVFLGKVHELNELEAQIESTSDSGPPSNFAKIISDPPIQTADHQIESQDSKLFWNISWVIGHETQGMNRADAFEFIRKIFAFAFNDPAIPEGKRLLIVSAAKKALAEVLILMPKNLLQSRIDEMARRASSQTISPNLLTNPGMREILRLVGSKYDELKTLSRPSKKEIEAINAIIRQISPAATPIEESPSHERAGAVRIMLPDEKARAVAHLTMRAILADVPWRDEFLRELNQLIFDSMGRSDERDYFSTPSGLYRPIVPLIYRRFGREHFLKRTEDSLLESWQHASLQRKGLATYLNRPDVSMFLKVVEKLKRQVGGCNGLLRTQ